MQFFILSFVGEDRPGFVHEITEVVSRHQGNWLESRMVRLGGKFAGLARVSVDEAAASELEVDVANLAQGRFSVIIRAADPEEVIEGKHYSLDIVGHDRPGIMNEITGTLAEHGINLVEVSSSVERAAMSGLEMFSCRATVEVSAAQSMETVDHELEAIGARLGVDIILEEIPDA